MLTKTAFSKLLNEAAALQKEIDADAAALSGKKQRLDALKVQIAAEMPTQPVATQTPTDGGGTTFRAETAAGASVRMTQAAPSLKRSFDAPTIAQLKTLCGRYFLKLFVPKYSAVAKFREQLFKILPDKETAQKVLKLVEVPGTQTVAIG